MGCLLVVYQHFGKSNNGYVCECFIAISNYNELFLNSKTMGGHDLV
jgi:hypothetical protein